MTDEARPIPEGLEEAIRPMLYEGTMLGFVNSQVEAIARFVMEREAAARKPLIEALKRADDYVCCDCIINLNIPDDICAGHQVTRDALRSAGVEVPWDEGEATQ